MSKDTTRRKTSGNSKDPAKAVILDRDNTLLDDPGYLADPEGIVFFPEVINSLRRLQEAGYLLVVVTNQSGIGRGYFNEETGLSVNLRMTELLKAQGISIAAVYYCQHHPDSGCGCRKPATLMAERAISDHRINRAGSWMVGDTAKDILMGIKAGLKPIMLMTGKASSEEIPEGVPVRRNLAEAVDLVLESCQVERT